MAIWNILLPFGIICCHLVYFVAIWYILLQFGIFNDSLACFPRFGVLYQEKSGNPVSFPKSVQSECKLPPIFWPLRSGHLMR
jgi:hypothetical protein